MSSSLDCCDHEAEQKNPRLRLWLMIVSGVVFTVGLILFLFPNQAQMREWLFMASLILIIGPILYDTIRGFRTNPFSENFLMGLAGVGAGVLGAWAEGAALLLVYNIAERVNEYTVDRVRNIAKSVAELLPKRALRKIGATLNEVAVEDLNVGDTIVVKAGWRVPIDGKIVAGTADIDQAIVTGESIPVQKTVGDVVLSGTLSMNGSLEIVVEKPYKESTVSRIVDMVTEAHERKAKIERIIDKFSRYYIPAMLVLAILIALIPPLFFGQSFQVWLYRSLIVLVISCPSALLISTPVTVLLGLTAAMRKGMLVKGGKYLEELAGTQVLICDKTGTITKGKLHVSKILTFNQADEKTVLRLAATLEAHSSHPIAAAIMEEAQDQKIRLPRISHISEISGKGLEAKTPSGTIFAGNLTFLKERKVALSPAMLEAAETLTGTLVGVAQKTQLIGIIAIEDEIRPEARETAQTLQSLGLKLAMVTGDNQKTADAVASQVGLDTVYANCLPEDKVSVAKDLRKRFGNIAMLGDGVNDAPVLAVANTGIAMGTAGNDIAIEAADVALMGTNLSSLPFLIRLSRNIQKRIKINITLALALKAVTIGLGAIGWIPLWVAIVADDGLTLAIVAFSLPILRLK